MAWVLLGLLGLSVTSLAATSLYLLRSSQSHRSDLIKLVNSAKTIGERNRDIAVMRVSIRRLEEAIEQKTLEVQGERDAGSMEEANSIGDIIRQLSGEKN